MMHVGSACVPCVVSRQPSGVGYFLPLLIKLASAFSSGVICWLSEYFFRYGLKRLLVFFQRGDKTHLHIILTVCRELVHFISSQGYTIA